MWSLDTSFSTLKVILQLSKKQFDFFSFLYLLSLFVDTSVVEVFSLQNLFRIFYKSVSTRVLCFTDMCLLNRIFRTYGGSGFMLLNFVILAAIGTI
jgi:hypothetical protein